MKENREKREINFEICIFADDFNFERKCESNFCFKSLTKQKSFKEDNASLSFHSFWIERPELIMVIFTKKI